MNSILLTTANARYHHASLALRSLRANMGELRDETTLAEFTINERPLDIAEKIVEQRPSIVGMAVYIWNLELLTEVVRLIRQVQPGIRIVVGGPEVSFPEEPPDICNLADHIVTGEGELAFGELCRDLLAGRTANRWINQPVDHLDDLELPYDLYTDDDIAHRTLYVEASRGCPYRCAFCLSALDHGIRRFDPERLLPALEQLWARGARQFKFIDRTLSLADARTVLDFFAPKDDPKLFLHFELVPDRLPDELFERLARFPAGAIQLEAGVQSCNEEVLERIGRKQDTRRALTNIERLLRETGVHVHSDLVVGLPGEELASIADGFDRLLATGVHEIQFGILKRLRGAPLARFDHGFGQVYRQSPPYDILMNDAIDFPTMQRLKRFARYLDLVFNNGTFRRTAPLIWAERSPFFGFLEFSDWLFGKVGQTAHISQARLGDLLFDFLVEQRAVSPADGANSLYRDLAPKGTKGLPQAVRQYATEAPKSVTHGGHHLPKRQQQHNC